MATRLIYRDNEWIVEGETLAELQLGVQAIALSNGTTSRAFAVATGGQGRRPGRRVRDESRRAELDRQATLFLRTISDRHGAPVLSGELVKVLRLASGKALGGVVGSANSMLRNLGIDPKNVYSSARLPRGEKRWKAEAGMAAALKKIELAQEVA